MITKQIQNCKNCELSNLPINKVKPFDSNRLDKKIVFVGQNPSYKRQLDGKIFEENNTSDRVMKQFLKKLNLTREDCYFTNIVKCSTEKNISPSKDSCNSCIQNFYDEINEIKPLLIIFISKFAYNLIDKEKIRCPIISLKHPSYYERLFHNDEITAYKMFEDLKQQTINEKIRGNQLINFITKEIYFKNENNMIEFISHINNMKIVEIDRTDEFSSVAIFNSNKKIFRVLFEYYNYCWIKCSEDECEKYSIDGNPCKKLFYREKQAPWYDTYERDIHSDYRFIIDYYDYFEPVKKEELNYLTYDIETNKSVDVVNTPGEIISIVYLMNNKYEFLFLDNKQNNFEFFKEKEDIKIFKTEKEMLEYFMNIFRNCNIITGFNINGFDNIYLINRAKKLGLNINNFSPIKRIFNRIKEEKDRMNPNKFKIHGLSIVDSMLYARDKYFIYSLDKPSQYNLDYLGKFLKLGTKVHDDRGPYTLWLEDPQKLYEYNIQDVKLCRQIENKIGMMNYLLSFKKLISTFNIQWSLYNSKIIDFFMLCNFSKDCCFPNKKDNQNEILEGAYVKEPIPGIYDNVAVADFEALYPNIIRQFNISYETISENLKESSNLIKIKNNDDFYNLYIDNKKEGIMPKIVNKLIFMKNDISKQIKTSNDSTLTVKYNAIKAVINGIYGVSKYKWFRMYNINCARLITYLARTLIKKVEEIVDKKENFISIYGDTDSVFIYNKIAISYNEAKKDFEQLIEEINREISTFIREEFKIENKYIKLDFETLFKRVLMTKAKKKYYGNGYYIKGKEFQELKEYGRGVDIVKKDTPLILRPLLKQLLLDIVNRKTDDDIRNSIQRIKKEIYNLEYQDLLITKQISREIEDYKTIPQYVRAMKYSNSKFGTSFNRANYKGGLLYVIHPETDVIMLENEMKLPERYLVDYEKYFKLFVENKVSLFMDEFKIFFDKNKSLNDWLK
jgi:uracil-DNA glycosylase family 4